MNIRMPIFLCLLVLPQLSWAISKQEFKEKMEQELKRLPGNTEISMQAEILGKREVLFAHKSDQMLIPASSMKLLLGVAALDTLGPGYTFKTIAAIHGTRSGAKVSGNLVLRGNGDPFLVSERLWLLARDVARSGIKEISGGIEIDNGFFSSDSRDLLKWNSTGEKYATVVSATSFNFNNLELHIMPDTAHGHVLVETGPVPHDYAIIHNQLKLTSGQSSQISIVPGGMQGDREVFTLTGSIGRQSAARIDYASVSNPSAYIAYAFAALLKSQGIKLGKDFAGLGRNISVGDSIAELPSLPLLDLVRSLNTYSNNFMTEQIFQSWGAIQMGQAASTEKSRTALKQFLDQHNICQSIVIDNGSGLSWEARVSAKCFVDLLQNSYRDFRIFADLLGSMAVGGSTGTLKNRFKGRSEGFDPLKVRAKTGTLWSEKPVTSLVGFTQTQTGETVVYAILLNNAKNRPALLQPMRDWEDKCVDLLQQLQL